MRSSHLVLLAGAILLFAVATVAEAQEPAEPDQPEPAKTTRFKSDRYSVELFGPAGWKKEMEGPKATGRWIDLVAFREPKTKAFIKVSCQASAYASFEEMERKLTAYYKDLGGITLFRGPERLLPAHPARCGPGLYVEFIQTVGKRSDRSFLVFWMNGRNTIRAYGSVSEKRFQKVEPAYRGFLASVHLFARSSTGDQPNFVHEGARCQLAYPEGWRVRIPARGPVAAFEGPESGAVIWLFRANFADGLRAYLPKRRKALEADGAELRGSPSPKLDEKRNETTLVLEYDKDGRRYREVCFQSGDSVYRLALGGSGKGFDRGLPALEKMTETIRFR